MGDGLAGKGQCRVVAQVVAIPQTQCIGLCSQGCEQFLRFIEQGFIMVDLVGIQEGQDFLSSQREGDPPLIV